MNWIIHYGKMIGSALILIFVVITVMFFLLEIAPGDPIQSLVGQVPVSEEFRAQMTEAYGLDRPLHERYFTYLANILTGNLGFSYSNQQPVFDLIMGRLGNTLILTIPSTILSSIGGILLGAIAARTRSRLVDGGISSTAIASFSLPNFWLALMLILLFSVTLGWLPAQGMSSFTSTGVDIRYMILPVISLAVAELAFKMRIMRSSMIEVLGQDYIDTARSKGLNRNQILWRHGMLNSMLPMVSVIGYSLGFTLAGSVLIEKVFGWPGMGQLLFDSIQRSDNMIVMGVLLIITVTVLIVNMLTDIVYGFVDPRIRARMRRAAGGAA